jgi:hypothetical protein
MSDRVLKAKREQMWSHVVAQVRQLLRNGAEAAGVIADGNDPDGGEPRTHSSAMPKCGASTTQTSCVPSADCHP